MTLPDHRFQPATKRLLRRLSPLEQAQVLPHRGGLMPIADLPVTVRVADSRGQV